MSRMGSPPIVQRFEHTISAQESRRQEDERRRRESLRRQIQDQVQHVLGPSVEGTTPYPEVAGNYEEKITGNPWVAYRQHRSELPDLEIRPRPDVPSNPNILPTRPATAISADSPIVPHVSATGGLVPVTGFLSALETRIHNQQVHIENLEANLETTRSEVQKLRRQRDNAEEDQRRADLKNERAEAERWRKLAESFADELKQKNTQLEKLEQQIDEGKSRELDLQRQLQEAKRRQISLDAENEALRTAAQTRVLASPPTEPSPEVVSTETELRSNKKAKTRKEPRKLSFQKGQGMCEVFLAANLVKVQMKTTGRQK